MTDQYFQMLANYAAGVGSAQSGEEIHISGRDEEGFLIIENQKKSYHLVNANNFFDGNLSGEAFRLALTIIAASHLSIDAYNRQLNNKRFAVMAEDMSNLYSKASSHAYATLSEEEGANLAAYLD